MKIGTERFGEIEIKETEIISFPKGIPGLDEYKKFVLFPVDEQDSPYFLLQSIEKRDLCFFLLDTLAYFTDYEIELDESTVQSLEVESPSDIIVFSLITVTTSLQEATANLKGPIILNVKKNLAKQVVLDKSDYLIKQPLFQPKSEAQQKESRG